MEDPDERDRHRHLCDRHVSIPVYTLSLHEYMAFKDAEDRYSAFEYYLQSSRFLGGCFAMFHLSSGTYGKGRLIRRPMERVC